MRKHLLEVLTYVEHNVQIIENIIAISHYFIRSFSPFTVQILKTQTKN